MYSKCVRLYFSSFIPSMQNISRGCNAVVINPNHKISKRKYLIKIGNPLNETVVIVLKIKACREAILFSVVVDNIFMMS